jgi:hypothetical protein
MTEPAGTPPEPEHAALDGAATPPEPEPAASGPDPEAPDDAHPWSEADRPRGLDAWFAPGGEDDAPPERIADERRLVRLLAIMLAALVGIPLLLTAVAFVIELTTGRGG